MKFPHIDRLKLPCTFGRLVPGKLHRDGRRYLPLIVLELPAAQMTDRAALTALGVVDRHHVVDPTLVGRTGLARLVLLLSSVRLQDSPPCQGLMPEDGLAAGRASIAPT